METKFCNKCGYKMKIHYQLFCPKCDVDVLELKTKGTFDLLKIMAHMEANGYMSERKFWNKFGEEHNYPENDSSVDVIIKYDDKKLLSEMNEFEQYYYGLSHILNIKNGEIVSMWISW